MVLKTKEIEHEIKQKELEIMLEKHQEAMRRAKIKD